MNDRYSWENSTAGMWTVLGCWLGSLVLAVAFWAAIFAALYWLVKALQSVAA